MDGEGGDVGVQRDRYHVQAEIQVVLMDIIGQDNLIRWFHIWGYTPM